MVFAFSDADLVKYVNTINIKKRNLLNKKIESQKQTFQNSKNVRNKSFQKYNLNFCQKREIFVVGQV